MMRDLLLLLIVAVTLWCSDAAPYRAIKTPSFIASLDKVQQRTRRDVPSPSEFPTNPSEKPKPLKIRALRASSLVTARFTKTVVESLVINEADVSQEVNFYMELPKEAFISGFLIETDGVVYNSRVDEKEAAQEAYDVAKSQGQTTGQVKQTTEEKNDFTISINVEERSELRFNLTYEELLKRKDGYFENVISVTPGQTVDHLIIDVHITEPQGIKEGSVDVFVKKLLADGREDIQRPEWAGLKGQHSDSISVQFHPTPVEQEAVSTSGNLGKFVVRYDVIHGQTAGNIEIVNGYFVHHFSPEGSFLPIQKNVVFVLDTSGSMSGTKIRQTKDAMNTILSDLREKDEFGIITFSSTTTKWKSRMVPANKDNVESAKERINDLYARGGTNLHGGIRDAIDMLEAAQYREDTIVGKFYLIIMLTDGMPTAGELTNPEDIKMDIRRQLEGRFSLFCLGFGDNVDYPFLEQLSLQNKGLARKIYEDSDAGLQLVGFFDEVATPLLVNVKMKYDTNMVIDNSISETDFTTYFEGTELVVAGQLVDNSSLPNTLTCVVTAETGGFELELELEVDVKEESPALLSPHTVDDFAQRLWAFLTIKELLQKRIGAINESQKEALTQKALDLSLKYHFVTPLTSLVIVKPNEDDTLIGEPEPRFQEDKMFDKLSHFSHPGPARQSYRPIRRQGGPVLHSRPKLHPNPRYVPIGNPGPSHNVGPGIATSGGGGGSTGGSVQHVRVPSLQLQPIQQVQYFMPVRPTHRPITTTTKATTTTSSIVATTTPQPTMPMGPPRRYRANFLMPIEGDAAFMCFNVRTKPGQLYKLIDDQGIGLTVSGRMASAYLDNNLLGENKTVPLILNQVTFQDGFLQVSPDGISVGSTAIFPWSQGSWAFTVKGLKLSLGPSQRLTVGFGADITLVIQRQEGNSSENTGDFLGLQIQNGQGFSDEVDGIIGQFERREVGLEDQSGDGNRRRAFLTVAGERVEARISERKDLREDSARECWWYTGSEDILENPMGHYRTRL